MKQQNELKQTKQQNELKQNKRINPTETVFICGMDDKCYTAFYRLINKSFYGMRRMTPSLLSEFLAIEIPNVRFSKRLLESFVNDLMNDLI